MEQKEQETTVNIFILLKKFLKDAENSYKGSAGFDMSYREFNDLCKQAWKDEEYICLHINRCKKKTEMYFLLVKKTKMKILLYAHLKQEVFE